MTNGQFAVLDALSNYTKGLDDQGLAVHVHHIADNDMSSSGVRTRRAELASMGFVTPVGVKRTRSGRSAAIHAVTAQGKAALRAERRSRRAVAVAA